MGVVMLVVTTLRALLACLCNSTAAAFEAQHYHTVLSCHAVWIYREQTATGVNYL